MAIPLIKPSGGGGLGALVAPVVGALTGGLGGAALGLAKSGVQSGGSPFAKALGAYDTIQGLTKDKAAPNTPYETAMLNRLDQPLSDAVPEIGNIQSGRDALARRLSFFG